jgi:hypothetical protein
MPGFTFSEDDIRRQVGDRTEGFAGSLTPAGTAAVSFRLHAILDGQTTEDRGYPAYKETVYFSRRDVNRGREDGVDRIATEEDFREHAPAYERFRKWIQDPQISVRMIPYLSPAVLRLLDDGQITTIQELASAPNLTFLNEEGGVRLRVAIDSVPELAEPKKAAKEWLAKRPNLSEALPETETDRLRRELSEAQAKLASKNKGGRVKGSKNKPKVPNAENPETNS